MMQIEPSGIDELDLLLGGGLPARQLVIVTGDPGTGKTILSMQIASSFAARGTPVVVATVTSEAQDKLLGEMSSFTFFDRRQVGDRLFLVSAYPWIRKGPDEARELLLRTVRDRKAGLLFVDGLRGLRDIWESEARLRDFLYELGVGLSQLGAITLLTTEYPLQRLMALPEATTVDGIIALSAPRFAGRMVRRIQVAKLRGRGHLTGEHQMRISREGIGIVPRLEETTAANLEFRPDGERTAFGLPELDAILHGGLPRMSTTLLMGSTGVGKTLLASHFAATGAATGEPSLLVTYSEPVGRLVWRARAVSLDLQPLIDRGLLHVRYRPPIDVEADELIREVLDLVQVHGIRRLVVDGVGEVEGSMLERDRIRPVLSSFIIRLRDLGVTTIFVKEVPRFARQEIDFSDSDISVTAENVLYFRHVEYRGKLHRIASVLKMRESGYDPHVREFEIRDEGVRVLGPFDSELGLLEDVEAAGGRR